MQSSVKLERPYAVGDIILVEQGSLLHDAKVTELGDGRDGQDVYIHYVGWNRMWDTWVQLKYTRPETPENRAEQTRMNQRVQQHQKQTSRKQARQRTDEHVHRVAST